MRLLRSSIPVIPSLTIAIRSELLWPNPNMLVLGRCTDLEVMQQTQPHPGHAIGTWAPPCVTSVQCESEKNNSRVFAVRQTTVVPLTHSDRFAIHLNRVIVRRNLHSANSHQSLRVGSVHSVTWIIIPRCHCCAPCFCATACRRVSLSVPPILFMRRTGRS